MVHVSQVFGSRCSTGDSNPLRFRFFDMKEELPQKIAFCTTSALDMAKFDGRSCFCKERLVVSKERAAKYIYIYYIYIYINSYTIIIYIYIYMVTPPRGDSSSSSWGGGHHTR